MDEVPWVTSSGRCQYGTPQTNNFWELPAFPKVTVGPPIILTDRKIESTPSKRDGPSLSNQTFVSLTQSRADEGLGVLDEGWRGDCEGRISLNLLETLGIIG